MLFNFQEHLIRHISKHVLKSFDFTWEALITYFCYVYEMYVSICFSPFIFFFVYALIKSPPWPSALAIWHFAGKFILLSTRNRAVFKFPINILSVWYFERNRLKKSFKMRFFAKRLDFELIRLSLFEEVNLSSNMVTWEEHTTTHCIVKYVTKAVRNIF